MRLLSQIETDLRLKQFSCAGAYQRKYSRHSLARFLHLALQERESHVFLLIGQDVRVKSFLGRGSLAT